MELVFLYVCKYSKVDVLQIEKCHLTLFSFNTKVDNVY